MDIKFKNDLRYRLCKLEMSQNQFAEKIGISRGYVSQIVNSVRETPITQCRKEYMLKKLEEFEREREHIGE